MPTAAAIADQIEGELAPLYTDVSRAWWDLNVDANEENERRRVELETALSDFLADADRFAADRGGAARSRRPRPTSARRAPRRAPPASGAGRPARRGSSSWRRRSSPASSQHRGVVAGRRGRRQRDQADPALERRRCRSAARRGRRRRQSAPQSSDDVRELARLRNEAARSLGYRDWFALAVATIGDGRGQAVRDARPRPTRRPLGRSPAGRQALDESLAARFGLRGVGAPAVALRRPVLPGGPGRGRCRARPRLRGSDLVELDPAHLRRARPRDCARSWIAATSTHATASASTRSASTSTARATSACSATSCTTRYWMDTMLHELGHGAFDAGLDPALPWLLRDCHLTIDGGHRDPHGTAREPTRDWLATGRRPRRRTRRTASRSRCAPPAPPSCSSSPAGCS